MNSTTVRLVGSQNALILEQPDAVAPFMLFYKTASMWGLSLAMPSPAHGGAMKRFEFACDAVDTDDYHEAFEWRSIIEHITRSPVLGHGHSIEADLIEVDNTGRAPRVSLVVNCLLPPITVNYGNMHYPARPSSLVLKTILVGHPRPSHRFIALKVETGKRRLRHFLLMAKAAAPRCPVAALIAHTLEVKPLWRLIQGALSGLMERDDWPVGLWHPFE